MPIPKSMGIHEYNLMLPTTEFGKQPKRRVAILDVV